MQSHATHQFKCQISPILLQNVFIVVSFYTVAVRASVSITRLYFWTLKLFRNMLWVTLPWLTVIANSAENSDLTKVSEQDLNDVNILCAEVYSCIFIHAYIYTFTCVHMHTQIQLYHMFPSNLANFRWDSRWYMDVSTQAYRQAHWTPGHRNELFTSLITSLNNSGGEECCTRNAKTTAKDVLKWRKKNLLRKCRVLLNQRIWFYDTMMWCSDCSSRH